jgi:hypothetical protein
MIFFVAAPWASADLIVNGSFETVTPALSANGICTSEPSVYPYSACSATGWSGEYQIGNGTTIGIGGSSFNIPQPDPGGSGQALILQGAVASASQSFDVTAPGVYTLTFFAANRDSPAFPNDNGPQTLTVSLDGVNIAGGTYSALPTTWTRETLNITLASGIQSLSFEGLGNGSGDVSAFVDDVSLVSSTPEPSSLALALMLLPAGVFLRLRQHRGCRKLSL